MKLKDAVELAASAMSQDEHYTYALGHLQLEPHRVVGTDRRRLMVVDCESPDIENPVLMTVEQARLYAALPTAECRVLFLNYVRSRPPVRSFPDYQPVLQIGEPVFTVYLNPSYLAELMQGMAETKAKQVRLDVYARPGPQYASLAPIRLSIEDWHADARATDLPVIQAQALLMPMKPFQYLPEGEPGLHAVAARKVLRLDGEAEASAVQNTPQGTEHRS